MGFDDIRPLSKLVNPCHLSVPETLRLPETRSWSLWKVKRVFIKCGRLCASYVQRRDGDLTVKISLPLWAGKFVQLLSIDRKSVV